jgi:hypothetical protein
MYGPPPSLIRHSSGKKRNVQCRLLLLLSIYVSISNLFFGELTVSEQHWSCCIGVDSLVLGDLYASNQTFSYYTSASKTSCTVLHPFVQASDDVSCLHVTKQQAAGRHVTQPGNIIPIPSLPFLLNAACIARKQQISIYSL